MKQRKQLKIIPFLIREIQKVYGNYQSKFAINIQKRNQSNPEVNIIMKRWEKVKTQIKIKNLLREMNKDLTYTKIPFIILKVLLKSPKSQQQPNMIQKEQQMKVPKKIKGNRCHSQIAQVRETQGLFKLKEKTNNSIIKLKQDVSKYIHLAKTQYNINVDELQMQSTKSKSPLILKIRNFEEDFKNKLAAHQISYINSEPYFKFNGSFVQENQFPILEEKSKNITNPRLLGDHYRFWFFKNQENFKECNKIHLIPINLKLYLKLKVMYKLINFYFQFTKTASQDLKANS